MVFSSCVIHIISTTSSAPTLEYNNCGRSRCPYFFFRFVICTGNYISLSPRRPHANHHHEGEHRAREGVQAGTGVRPRARIYTHEEVVVCCLHRLVLSFRRISFHICNFFIFFRVCLRAAGFPAFPAVRPRVRTRKYIYAKKPAKVQFFYVRLLISVEKKCK